MSFVFKQRSLQHSSRWRFSMQRMRFVNAVLLLGGVLASGPAAAANEADNSDLKINSSNGSEAGDSHAALVGKVPPAAIRHNPFALPAAIKAQRNPPAKQSLIDLSGGLQLRAILFSHTNPLVNLNGKILAVGEEIQGYRLARVFKTRVELIKNAKTYELKLNEESAPSHG